VSAACGGGALEKQRSQETGVRRQNEQPGENIQYPTRNIQLKKEKQKAGNKDKTEYPTDEGKAKGRISNKNQSSASGAEY